MVGSNNRHVESRLSQEDRFKQAARAADCDPDEARWDEVLKRVVKQKPEKGPDSSGTR
jgi:hypothetical protein